ncbi:Fpg/Nei family DNA glycosylase [soil metagenome]
MPELPEVEITARRLGAQLAGAEIESALAPGMVALKSIDPPLSAITGARVAGTRRFGKMPVVDFEAVDDRGTLSLLVHLMSAGRLQVFDKRASLRDRASRVLVRLADGRELRLREFGTKQRAWAKLLPNAAVAEDEMVATLGPEAWPAPPLPELAKALDQPRHLHPLLRDQRTIAGIGRQWVDEILWESRLSPFKKGSELSQEEIERLRDALAVLGSAIDHYEEVIGHEVPNKLPLPLKVHKREGDPCPRCGTKIEAIFYSEHQTNYCPQEQTGGRVLADRRLSRLLK